MRINPNHPESDDPELIERTYLMAAEIAVNDPVTAAHLVTEYARAGDESSAMDAANALLTAHLGYDVDAACTRVTV